MLKPNSKYSSSLLKQVLNMFKFAEILMLRVYGVGGKLLKAVPSFYIERACVRIGNYVSDWFQVNVALRRLCDVFMLV